MPEIIKPEITQTLKAFKIKYTLRTRTPDDAGGDIQFGMDFKLSTTGRALAQLIFPATRVGTNIPGRWNIDNHRVAGTATSLIFNRAENGLIEDIPTELSHSDEGVKSTKFAVYRVDVENAVVESIGVQFGYRINTSDRNPETQFLQFQKLKITNEHKRIFSAQCDFIKYV